MLIVIQFDITTEFHRGYIEKLKSALSKPHRLGNQPLLKLPTIDPELGGQPHEANDKR